MIKRISYFFFVGGFIFISIATLQWYQTNKAQSGALAEARTILQQDPSQRFLPSQRSSGVANELPKIEGEVIGILHLPRIEKMLPIVQGTTEDALKKGVGHYAGTALPNEQDQIVLSGHRDTVFRQLGELQVGDEIRVDMVHGSYTYIIQETFVVDAEDRTVIKSTAPKEVLTITTCYPFNYIGNAPQRYIINALRKG